MRDAVIIGGGPSGCFTGRLLAERGFDVAIIEEHAEVGHPVCCAGIVGIEGLKELGIKPRGWVLNELKRAVFHPPSGKPVEIGRGRVEAFVIDRASFDRELAMDAAEAGADLLMKTKCVDVKLDGKPSVKVKEIGEKAEIQTRLIIGADGPTSLVARKAGLLGSAPSYIRCAQVELLAEVDPDTVELFFGRTLAPDFFAWIAPAGDGCRVGLGTSEGSPVRMLHDFIEKHPTAPKKMEKFKILHFTAGLIPGPLSRKIYADHVLLVGGAAGHVKPLTGGGIYLGLSFTRLAAEAAAGALEGEPTAEALCRYEFAVKEKFGRDLKLELRAHKLFKKLSDEDLDLTFALLARPDIQAILLKHADFDHHGKLVKAFAKKAPSLLRTLGPLRIIRFLSGLSG